MVSTLRKRYFSISPSLGAMHCRSAQIPAYCPSISKSPYSFLTLFCFNHASSLISFISLSIVEPSSALDEASCESVESTLCQLNCIWVTHNPQQAKRIASAGALSMDNSDPGSPTSVVVDDTRSQGSTSGNGNGNGNGNENGSRRSPQ